MTTAWIEIATSDGPMQAYVAEPDGGGPRPGVVVLQEAFGVNAYVRSVCDSLSQAGYLALAPELLHRAGTHVELSYEESDRARVLGVLGTLTNAMIETDVVAAYGALRARTPGRLALLGFCMGGFSALCGALATDAAAVVAFYPGGLVNVRPRLSLSPFVDRLAGMRAATLVHFGGDDAGIPPSDVDAVRAALARSPARHEVIVWPGAKHGFHSFDRTPVYDAHSAELAWQRTLAWLGSVLGSAP